MSLSTPSDASAHQWLRWEEDESPSLNGDECAWDELVDPLVSPEDSVPSLSPYPAAFHPRSTLLPSSPPLTVRCRFPPAVLPAVSHPHPSLVPVGRRRHKMLFEGVSDQCGLGSREARTKRRDEQGIAEPQTVCQWPLDKPNHGAGPATAAETAAHRKRFGCDWLAGGFFAGSGPAIVCSLAPTTRRSLSSVATAGSGVRIKSC